MSSDKGSVGGSWLSKLLKLRPSSGGRSTRYGVAPHKPLLLLCLLDIYEEGDLPQKLTRSASLTLRFRAYATLVSERWPTRLDIRLPFFHLKTQGFWKALDATLKPATAPENCVTIELDPEFLGALADPSFRLDARLILTRTYFTPTERVALLEAMGLRHRHMIEEESDRLIASAEEGARRKGRSARFQIGVVDGYRHTCALTGYRCFTDEGASVVDAAHIEAWAESQNDDLGNGLALSKTAHWMFDEGLWSVTEDLRIVIRPTRFTESGPDGLRLANFANQQLRFDPAANLRPSRASLRNHRQKYGFPA